MHEDNPNHWREFGYTLWIRFRKPWQHPTYVLYFFFIIILIGGFGILELVVRSFMFGNPVTADLPKALIGAFYTYFTAIAATAAVDLLLTSQEQKHLRICFMILCFLVLVSAFFAVLIAETKTNLLGAYLCAGAGYILSLFLWWIGNADNANLLDSKSPPTAPTGGDPASAPLGNLSGFEA
jgi:hypothetical protein